jgi:hypothetical protein
VSEQEARNRENTKKRNSRLIAEQLDFQDVETIFIQSHKLSLTSIEAFIDCLCRVSKKELEDEFNPIKFSLQKIVEVASQNMDRVRLDF